MEDKNIRIKFTDIVGYEMEKESLKEKVILPILYPILFQGKRAQQTNTILYGPSGTGKSYLSKAVLNEMVDKNKFFSLSFDKIINKTIEQRISLIKELFESARKQKPSIIFIDEIDLILNYKIEEKEDTQKFLNEFCLYISSPFVNKENEGLIIFGASNKPWDIIPLFRRKFRRIIYTYLPDLNDRKTLMKLFIGNNDNNITDEDLEKLGNLTEGYSQGEIHDIINMAIKSTNSCITFENIFLSLRSIKPLITKNDLEKFEKFKKEFS